MNVEFTVVNGRYGPTNLAVASAAGIGMARTQVIKGQNADPIVALAAAAHLRLNPTMGLPGPQLAPAAAAKEMAQFVTSFARRYGPHGSFWSQHSTLPYLPVRRYEIGNEPNIPMIWVADSTHLHWADPSAYAQVYEAARAALHRVVPGGKAVVGGLADSASLGVDLRHDEQWLAALPPGQVDAVGYHPYTFDVTISLIRPDTLALRRWMDAHRLRGTPLDINEVGACDVTHLTTNNQNCRPDLRISSADWGAFTADYTQWVLCTPGLGVESIQPEYWGATPGVDSNTILSIVSSQLALTPYGQAYVGKAKMLTTQGCPGGLSPMRLWLSRVHRHGRNVNLTVAITPGSGRVIVTATNRRRHRVRLRALRHRPNQFRVTYTATLNPGRWTLTVTARPGAGYAAPHPQRRTITISRRAPI